MTGTPLILAIDQGTQSVRAMLFDTAGQLVAKSQVHIEPYFSVSPGAAEQHPDYFWQHLCQACQGLWQQEGEAFSRQDIIGAGLTTQRATVVALDDTLKPVRPAIIWLDQRRTDNYPALPLYWKLLVGAAGQSQTLSLFQAKAECNWLAADEPGVWQKTAHYMLLSGYLTWRLTGKLVDSTASQVGYLPFDFKKQDWAGKWDVKWHALAVKREQLPDLVPAGQPLGQISATAAAETGLPEGLTLFSCGADKACEVLGCGALTPDTGSISYGTTATFNTSSHRYVEPVLFVPPYPAAIPDHYNAEVIVQRGYWMINWFKKEFAALEVQQAEQRGIEPEVLLEGLLRESPAGAMGLILQPFWNPGVKVPGPEAKGSIIGFGDVHTKAHLYRAIIEGIAYALREGKERLEKRNRQPIRTLRISGGGSQSDEIMRISASVFNMPVERPHTWETSGLGAAINVAVGTGLYPDYPAAVAQMVRMRDRFEPNPDDAQRYDQLYRLVYHKLYGRLAPLYRQIRKITGYPAY